MVDGARRFARWVAACGGDAKAAAILGTDKASVWRWRTGKVRPRVEWAAQIEASAGIPARTWALGGSVQSY